MVTGKNIVVIGLNLVSTSREVLETSILLLQMQYSLVIVNSGVYVELS